MYERSRRNDCMNELAPGELVRTWDVFFEEYKN